MKRLAKLMLAILSFWKENARDWYEKSRIYREFQRETIDISSFTAFVEEAILSLKTKFLGSEFGKDAKYVNEFMEKTCNGVLLHTTENGKTMHMLYCIALCMGRKTIGMH